MAVFVLIGGHWAVLQTAAWAGMLYDYSRAYGVSEGVAKTFDGAHPCKLCLKVKAGENKEEQKAPLFKSDKKAEVFLISAQDELPKPQSRLLLQSMPWKLSWSTRTDSLPSPIPRSTIS